jgi:Zn-dependent protease with chaperone function
MLLRSTLLLLLTLTCGITFQISRLATETPTEAHASKIAVQNSTAYTLPHAKLEKATALNRIRMTLDIAATVWTPLQLLLILILGGAAWMRDAAVRLSNNLWVQGVSFFFLLLLVTFLLNLPLGIYGHRVALSYGLSVQGWDSWLGDKAKLFALEWAVGSHLALIMFWVIRKSPKRWWFWFWIPAVASVLAGVFLTPYVIDPIFNKFEPLAATDSALVERLERVVARGGLSIPPDRMFLMKASAKSNEMNAYVTGFGASKRVVVWDTTIAKSSPDDIAFIFAHEMGHYALDHVVLGVGLSCLGLLPFFWIGYHGQRLVLARFGAAWRIPTLQDWAALVALALVLVTLSILSEPFNNVISRAMEHNADVYGQEAVHGIVADPQTVGQRSFQTLGEDSLDDPTPHPLFDWWFGTHPPTRLRAAFAEAYDPWAADAQPKYFAK